MTIIVIDVYLRTTDAKSNVHRSQHRVWDAMRFFSAKEVEAARENEKENSTLAEVEGLTIQQYRGMA